MMGEFHSILRRPVLLGFALMSVTWFSTASAQETGAPGEASPAERPALPPETADEHYDEKLRELEEKVVTLKEKIFRSKTRLLLLKERILNDVIAEAKLVVLHVNDMGGSFKPVKVHYRLDGESLKMMDNSNGALDDDEPLEIFAGNVGPGNHSLTVEMVYRGDSMIFTYLRDYLFKLRASLYHPHRRHHSHSSSNNNNNNNSSSNNNSSKSSRRISREMAIGTSPGTRPQTIRSSARGKRRRSTFVS